MDVELAAPRPRVGHEGGRLHRILHGASVIAGLAVRMVDAVPLEQAADEVGLAAHQVPGHDAGGTAKRLETEMLAVQDALRLHQLLVERPQGKDRKSTRLNSSH